MEFSGFFKVEKMEGDNFWLCMLCKLSCIDDMCCFQMYMNMCTYIYIYVCMY